MSLIPGTTEVFSADQLSKGCAVVFLSRLLAPEPDIYRPTHRQAIIETLEALDAEGWRLGVRAMFEPGIAPEVFDTGFAHDVDCIGIFEAPGLSEALEGTVRLERAGWNRRFTTEWVIAPRELAVIPSSDAARPREWGFVAFWEWNDARCAATPEERRANDADCDIAFQADLDAGVSMTGRHRSDWMHAWQHMSVWEAESPALIDHAMYLHERVLDFRFTTSRHYVGRRRPLAQFLALDDAAGGVS